MRDYMTELNQSIQKQCGVNIRIVDIQKTGADHCPVVTAKIEVPGWGKFSASSTNRKKAQQEAARIAIETIQANVED